MKDLWRGKPIEDMEKPELLKVIEGMANMLKLAEESHDRTLNMWSLCNKHRLSG